SAVYPHFNFTPIYNNSGFLFKANVPSGVMGALPTPVGQAAAAQIPTVFRIHNMLYVFPVVMLYELDLWGKYRSQYISSYRSFEGEIEAYYTAIQSLTANLASAYYNLRTFDTSLEILKATLETRRKDYAFNLARYEKGIDNYSAVTLALEAYSTTEAQ